MQVFCDVCAERPTLRELSAPFALRILVAQSLRAMTTATHKRITGFAGLGPASPIHATAVAALLLAPDALNVVMAQVLVGIRGASILLLLLFQRSRRLKCRTYHYK